MSDIIISRKLADGSVARPQVSTATASTVATIANAPASIANAAVGTLIKALVASQTARGFTTLQTDKGTLTLQTATPLKPGSEVVLQVQSSGTQTRVQILSVDHQPLAQGTKQTQATGQPAPQAAASAIKASPSQAAVPGQTTFNAIDPKIQTPATQNPNAPKGLQGSAARTSGSGEGTSPLNNGAILPARVIRIPTSGLATITTQANTPGAAKPFAATPGDTLTLRVLAVGADLPGQPITPKLPPSRPDAPVIAARILESTTIQAGSPQPGSAKPVLLAVGDARLAVAASASLPAGSEALFEVLDSRPPVGRDAAQASYTNFLRLGTEWKALKEAIALQPAIEAAAGTTETIVPRPGPQLASSLLFFMSALGTGNLHAWLGGGRADAMMQAGHGQLLAQLTDEFTQMGRHAADTQGTGWHALAVPVQNGAHTEQLRVFYRRHHGDGADGQNEGATHFMVEAELSRIGLFQLEGLVRRRHFDLVIHSTMALDSGTQGAIREIFQDALSTGELAGTLRFSPGDNKPFNPPGISPADHAATLTA